MPVAAAAGGSVSVYDHRPPWTLLLSAAEELALSALSTTAATLGLLHRPRTAAKIWSLAATAMALVWAAAAAAAVLTAEPTPAGGGDDAGAGGRGLTCAWHAAAWLLFAAAVGGDEPAAPARAAALGLWVVGGRAAIDCAALGDPGGLAADPPFASVLLAAAAVAAWAWQRRALRCIAAAGAADRALLRVQWAGLTAQELAGAASDCSAWAAGAEKIRAAAVAAAAICANQQVRARPPASANLTC